MQLTRRTIRCSRWLSLGIVAQPRSYGGIRLIALPERDDLKVMSIRHNSDAATIRMTEEGLDLLSERRAARTAGPTGAFEGAEIVRVVRGGGGAGQWCPASTDRGDIFLWVESRFEAILVEEMSI